MVRIVVGYDVSPAAEAVLGWVTDRARDIDARVELVTVTNMVVSPYLPTDEVLDDAARRLRDAHVNVTTHSVEGPMPNALLDEADHADLLVIGLTHSRPLRTVLKGKMPARAASRARIPTVFVPEGWEPNDHPVTVGVDDDPSSDAAIVFAAEEARGRGVPLRVVHAWQMPLPTMEGSVALVTSPLQARTQHRRLLEEVTQRVQQDYPDLVVESALVADNAPAALLARADHSSLLVLGTHRRGLLAGLTLGSVARDLLFRVSCPTCIVPNPPEQ